MAPVAAAPAAAGATAAFLPPPPGDDGMRKRPAAPPRANPDAPPPELPLRSPTPTPSSSLPQSLPTALLGEVAHTLPQFVSGLAVSLGFGLVGVVGTTVNGDLLRRVAAGHADERGLLPPGGAAPAAAEAAVRARQEKGRRSMYQLPSSERGRGRGLVDAHLAAGGPLAVTAGDDDDGGDDEGVGVGQRGSDGRRGVRRATAALVVEEPGGWLPPPPASDYGDGGDWARDVGWGEGGGWTPPRA
ncbi:hypothetical protein MMPV_001382 [Pyropia vietnamensis]